MHNDRSFNGRKTITTYVSNGKTIPDHKNRVCCSHQERKVYILGRVLHYDLDNYLMERNIQDTDRYR